MSNIKKELYINLLNQINERIKTAELNIQSAKSSAENETKSSAGDKYETAREMMQQEISMNQMQLIEANKLKSIINQINPNKNYDKVSTGSLVYTNIGVFYISVGASPIQFEGIQYQPVSSVSPIARALVNKYEGDSIIFNTKVITIINVQ